MDRRTVDSGNLNSGPELAASATTTQADASTATGARDFVRGAGAEFTSTRRFTLPPRPASATRTATKLVTGLVTGL